MSSEANLTNVREEDKDFIRVIATLAPENLTLIKGIVIGLQLQESRPTEATQPT